MNSTRGTEGDSPESAIDAATADDGSPIDASIPTDREIGDAIAFHSPREPRNAGSMDPIGSGRGVS
ncbi:MAG: hypothetical protein ACOYLU_13095 [Limisphaerales bacterium]